MGFRALLPNNTERIRVMTTLTLVKKTSFKVASLATTILLSICTPVPAFMFGTSGIQFDRDTNINFTFDSSHGRYQSSLWVAQADSGNTGYSSIARLFYESQPSAHYCYSRWGAKAKVEDLESRYPQFISKALAEKRPGLHNITRNTSTTESKAEVLELATVIKASQAINSEIVL